MAENANHKLITASHWGLLRPQVENGRLVRVLPFEGDPAPSPNLDKLCHLPYSQTRIKYPMVRESYLKAGISSREMRGKDRWVRVSWEKALELVSSELERVYAQWGPSAVWGRSYGWKSTGKVNSSITLLNRLLNLKGGYIAGVNSYSTAAISTILPYVVGSKDPKGSSWYDVIEHSEQVVFWSCDPLITNDVDWTTTLHQSKQAIDALKAKGIRTIAINPVKPETADYLDSEWIAPAPGTDCALMLGVIYELETTGRADHVFLDRYTVGWEQFKQYLFGLTDGVAKTVEWAASVTGVSAQTIRRLAGQLHEKRTMLMLGWGFQRIQYGEQPHWMGYVLASVLGQIGLPGGGIGCNYHYSNGGMPRAVGPTLGGISPNVQPVCENPNPWVGSRYIPVARFADCFLNPGKTIEHNGNHLVYPHVRLVFWAGGNPFAHQPQTNLLAKAWKCPETVIVSDVVWTATARHADIVLPACSFFERADITDIGTYTNDGLVAMHQVIEPQWESKSDYWICTELAKRLGVEAEFTEGLDEMGWIRRTYEEGRAKGLAMGVTLPDFDTFWERGYWLYEAEESEKHYIAYQSFRADPETNPLRTESGKIQIFSPKVDSYGYDDCRGYPTFIEPSEWLSSDNKDFPLAYMACKSQKRLHSQLDGAPDASESDQEPLWINPLDARERGIKTGDLVVASNSRGALLAKAVVTDKIRPQVVLVRHGAWFDPKRMEQGELDVHGNSNTLTMDVPTSRLACGNVSSSGLVQVRRYSKAKEAVAVRTEPEWLEEEMR